ncbi:hypothetical protein ABXN37_20640 [Piscinibacter sakaiensis]|uniref:hypothetical protein n=1 Tax=Piscinibacter sakaiensis TaxID=1547922 RepID=UPI0012FC0C09|nr:hypothetical protein [Piscinibacter sakaiensis]
MTDQKITDTAYWPALEQNTFSTNDFCQTSGVDDTHSVITDFVDWCRPIADKGAWAIAGHTITATVLGILE